MLPEAINTDTSFLLKKLFLFDEDTIKNVILINNWPLGDGFGSVGRAVASENQRSMVQIQPPAGPTPGL